MNKKILIIDDDLDMCTLLSRFLGKKGYDVDSAHSASKGIAKVAEGSFDIVLCDFRLGDKDGKDVFVGGLITSVFFTLGKLAIGYYLGRSNIASVYGAAGSIMIIMVWVYYSSIILYLGAEFTKVYAKMHGGKIYPNEYAIWIKTEETQVANPVLKKDRKSVV